MARGGFRPGAGRPIGATGKKPKSDGKKTRKPREPKNVGAGGLPLNQSDADKIRAMLAIDLDTRKKAKQYGEFLARASKGETLTAADKKSMALLRSDLENRIADKRVDDTPGDNPDAKAFLEKLLMAPDSEVDRKTKIQISNILLPFQHARKGEGAGKKEGREERAKAASSGKFSASKPPQLKAVK